MSDRPHEASTSIDRAELTLRLLAYGLGGALAVLSLWVVVQRFRYPVDGEWMTGAVRDGVDRLRDGKPLYDQPSAYFVPFIYTPLYMWTSSVLAHLMPTFVACKVTSLAMSCATAWGIHRIARSLGATLFWSRLAILFYVATYSLTLFFYDLERVDTTSAAMVVVGLAILFAGPSLRTTAIGGAILGAAFFAKQPGLIAYLTLVGALLVARETRRAMVAAGAGGVTFLALFAYLSLRTGPWFRFYCLTLPGSHGIKGSLVTVFFITDAPKAFAYALATVSVGLPILLAALVRLRPRKDGSEQPAAFPWQDTVFASEVLAGMFAAWFMRAHFGGWVNVLVAWLPLSCAAIAIGASRAEAWADQSGRRRQVRMVLLGVTCLQFLGAMFDPNDNSPDARDVAERKRLIALTRKLETKGDVIDTITGNIGTRSSAHAAALFDIVRSGFSAPADLMNGLEEHKFAALIVGSPDEFRCKKDTCEQLVIAILRNYFVAGRRHERERSGMTGFDARARFVLLPRKAPLQTHDMDELLFHMRTEIGFAEVRTAQTPFDDEIEPAPEIEDLANAEVKGKEAPRDKN